jgi:hypothetical protein
MFTGHLFQHLDSLVTRALNEHLHEYVLQNSEGRVIQGKPQRLMHWEAERKNRNLAELQSDYRWVKA